MENSFTIELLMLKTVLALTSVQRVSGVGIGLRLFLLRCFNPFALTYASSPP